jgi:acetolactate synthase I/II/III large subunit
MRSRQLAESATAGLRRAGVRRLFGLPGGGPNLDLIGAAPDLPFTLAHGEAAACVMAGAFGLLTGTAGVAVVTRGPGVTSAANGLAQATLDRAPLLLVSDCVTADQRGRVAHQRLDQLALTAPVTRFSGVVGHTDAAATVAGAAALALGPPAGAVHLDYDPSVAGDRPPAPCPRTPPDPGALAAASAVARGRRRPVVVLGLGAVPHAAALREVLTGIPVLTTYQATGTVSGTDWAGPFTNAALERPLLEQADLVIGVGLDEVEPIPAAWTTAAPTVLLDADATAYFDGAATVPGPPVAALRALLAACSPNWPSRAGRHHLDAVRARLADGPDGALRPVDLVRAVHAATGDALLTVDAGAHMLAALPFWPVQRPRGLLISNGLATMGYALPAAIGAALAGARVVCLTGDGGLGMVLAELETLARLALPVTVVVFNDAALSLIEIKQGAGQGDATAVRYAPTDFAAAAAALGVPSAAVDSTADATRVLRAAGPGPFLLDARVDPASYRHLMAVSRG